jgi:hypothetical protein
LKGCITSHFGYGISSSISKREYNLKYLGKIGNVFHTKDIEAAIEKGRKYNPDNFNPSYYFTSRSMGIDPACVSSYS